MLQVYGTCRPDQNSLDFGPRPGCGRSDIPNDIEPGPDLKVLMLDSIEQLADVDLDSMSVLKRGKVVKEGQHSSRLMVLVYTFIFRDVIECM